MRIDKDQAERMIIKTVVIELLRDENFFKPNISRHEKPLK